MKKLVKEAGEPMDAAGPDPCEGDDGSEEGDDAGEEGSFSDWVNKNLKVVNQASTFLRENNVSVDLAQWPKFHRALNSVVGELWTNIDLAKSDACLKLKSTDHDPGSVLKALTRMVSEAVFNAMPAKLVQLSSR
eukprot:7807359-Pyramimonas_sp.AAC.1